MQLQVSSGSSRERWIKALLPAAVIVAVYMVLIHTGRSRTTRELQKELAEAQKRAVSESELAALHAQYSAAVEQQDRLTDQMEEVQRGIDASRSQFTGGPATERMSRISQLCGELSIALLRQMPAKDVQLSDFRKSSLETAGKLVGNDLFQYRQLELMGSYANIESFLRRLPASVEGVIPLGVELLEAKADGSGAGGAPDQRRWRVYLLM